MKILTPALAVLTASALALSPVALRAQDSQYAPPPPMDNGGAPPPPDQDQSAPPPSDQSGDDSGASFDQFYNGLSNDGQWIQTPDYGYVFQPEVTDPNWAPYTEGHWVYTDYGWTWASDEPWGWATYHYGRWVNLDGTGWVWVPGYQWAPAWVSWRYGGGYCGWAPLPPSTFVGVEFGGNLGFDFHFGSDVDTAYGIGPAYYNFIPVGYIGDPSYHHWYMDRSRNFTIINNTTNITNIYVSRHPGAGAFSAVRVHGPALAQINAVSRTPVQQVRLSATAQAGAGRVSGGTLSVFAPHINPATLHTSRPATVARTLSTVQVNRGTNVTRPLQVNSHFTPVQPSASVISAARAAQAHAPSTVATASRIKSTARLSAPLTSMQTTAQQPRTSSPAGNGFTHTQAEPTQQPSGYNADGAVQHPSGYNANGVTQQPQHNAEVQQPSLQNQQAEEQQRAQQQQATEQEHAQQQREDEVRQQQAQEQQHAAAAEQAQREEAVHQQQAAVQEHAQQQATEQRAFSQPVQQHVSEPQIQEHAPAPQVHASAPPAQHAAAPSGGGDKKLPPNGQNH